MCLNLGRKPTVKILILKNYFTGENDKECDDNCAS